MCICGVADSLDLGHSTIVLLYESMGFTSLGSLRDSEPREVRSLWVTSCDHVPNHAHSAQYVVQLSIARDTGLLFLHRPFLEDHTTIVVAPLLRGVRANVAFDSATVGFVLRFSLVESPESR